MQRYSDAKPYPGWPFSESLSIMSRFLVLVAFLAVFSLAAAVKEWKNFENGKVYSHKTPSAEKKQTAKNHGAHKTMPVVEERLLHSHHREKTKDERRATKNPERHHKKNVEEQMHLRPLNERHHKFPNPALLNKIDDGSSNTPSPQISRHKLMKQEAEKHMY